MSYKMIMDGNGFSANLGSDMLGFQGKSMVQFIAVCLVPSIILLYILPCCEATHTTIHMNSALNVFTVPLSVWISSIFNCVDP